MRAIELNRYGERDVLTLNPYAPDPALGEGEVLIRLLATSVNPVDAVRRSGYGRRVFELRGAKLPVILGHDASGEAVAVGPKVTRFKVGDVVWSAPDAFRQGTYAECVAVRESEVDFKPESLTHEEAASLPYVALTTWSALVGTGAIEPGAAQGKKVLVHAGAGGVGSFAIQLLKAWGAEVATTCSTANVDFCRTLGADHVVDYTNEDYAAVLSDYDVVFDTLGYAMAAEMPSLSVLKRGGGAHYVSIVHQLLPSIDEYGLPLGLLRAGSILMRRKLSQKLRYGRHVHWALFEPSGKALSEIRALVEAGKIKPQIAAVLPLDQMGEAHRLIETGHTRGKIVVTTD